MKIIILATLLLSTNLFAAQSRTFSCGGSYEDSSGQPFMSIHDEVNYEESKKGVSLELTGEDSRFVLKGSLTIKDNKEFFNLELTSKETGITVFNNNSQLGQPANNGFNFVFLGLRNIGLVETSYGDTLMAKKASFQCQSYKN